MPTSTAQQGVDQSESIRQSDSGLSRILELTEKRRTSLSHALGMPSDELWQMFGMSKSQD